MSTTSGLCEVTPGRVLGAERITNAKLNDLGNPTVRVQAGAIGARELDPSVLSGTTPAPGSVTEATIVDAAVTNAKLADMASGTIKGRRTAGTGDAEDMTGIQTIDDILSPAEASVASAGTTDIGAVTSPLVQITGTTTITALGTAAAGRRRLVRFAGALTLTHNATSLILPGGANITTAAGDTAEFISAGSGNWRCVRYTKANGAPPRLLDEDDMASNSDTMAPTQQSVKAYVDAVATNAYILIQDRKASGTDGGTFTSGARRDRTLNTIVQDTAGLASLSGGTTGTGGTANTVTLPAGTYYVRGSAPAFRVDNHRAWLYDATNAVDLIIGTTEHSRTDNNNAQTRSTVQGRITLAGSTNLKLQHRCESSFSSTGLGEGDSFDVNIYSQLEIWKVG